MEPTDDQVERMARTFHARTREGRDGFAWPINGERNRQRSLDDARRALRYVLNGPADRGSDD